MFPCKTDPFLVLCDSVNPRLDVGQIEGAFVQGMGYFLAEKTAYDEESGEQLSVGTLVSYFHMVLFC